MHRNYISKTYLRNTDIFCHSVKFLPVFTQKHLLAIFPNSSSLVVYLLPSYSLPLILRLSFTNLLLDMSCPVLLFIPTSSLNSIIFLLPARCIFIAPSYSQLSAVSPSDPIFPTHDLLFSYVATLLQFKITYRSTVLVLKSTTIIGFLKICFALYIGKQRFYATFMVTRLAYFVTASYGVQRVSG